VWWRRGEGESERLRQLKFQRALDRDRAFGLLDRSLQIHAVLSFRSRPEKSFSVLALLRSLIGAKFQPEPINWRLFFDFGPFMGSVRDALSK
jgi:hypothetical protein